MRCIDLPRKFKIRLQKMHGSAQVGTCREECSFTVDAKKYLRLTFMSVHRLLPLHMSPEYYVYL